ncbi:MAG: Sulfide dehydrogenase subunit alpha precursor [Methanocella sp. PtaU1.Bin125]|nr:MAG: Sulfide dehydrogenase subunit alpha precursor [Methanocella sp. PtaU1.Bin125]
MSDKIFDIAIIGAGPAGLTSAIYCGRANLSTVVIGNVFDSQVAKAGDIQNYPGIASIQGIELIEKFQEHAERYDIAIVPSNVTRIIPGDVFTLYTDTEEYRSRSIIVATGAKHRELNIPGEKAYTYKGVSYCSICDGLLYKGKKVAVVGHGEQAAKATLYLAGLCSEVVMLTDRPDIDSPTYENQILSTGNIRVVTGAKVLSIEGNELVSRIKYAAREGPATTEAVEGVFIEGGMPNSLIVKELGVGIDPKGNVIVHRPDQSTDVPGVFAAGDITGGIHQISKAVGEGASAAMSAMLYVKSAGKRAR